VPPTLRNHRGIGSVRDDLGLDDAPRAQLCVLDQRVILPGELFVDGRDMRAVGCSRHIALSHRAVAEITQVVRSHRTQPLDTGREHDDLPAAGMPSPACDGVAVDLSTAGSPNIGWALSYSLGVTRNCSRRPLAPGS